MNTSPDSKITARSLYKEMERSKNAFVAIDYNFTFLEVNATAEKFYKHPRAALIGKDVKSIFPNEWNFGPFQTIRKQVDARASFQQRYHSPFANQWVELEGKPYDDFYTFIYTPIDHKEILRQELRSTLKK